MDAKTERLIAAVRAWAARRPEARGTTQVIHTVGIPDDYVVPSASLTSPPDPIQQHLAEVFAAKKAELEAAGLLPLSHHQPPRRTP